MFLTLEIILYLPLYCFCYFFQFLKYIFLIDLCAFSCTIFYIRHLYCIFTYIVTFYIDVRALPVRHGEYSENLENESVAVKQVPTGSRLLLLMEK